VGCDGSQKFLVEFKFDGERMLVSMGLLGLLLPLCAASAAQWLAAPLNAL
jgi:hypothetical protein